jgi:hypothetical protein
VPSRPARRIRRSIRVAALLSVVGLRRLACPVWGRRFLVLAGGVLTVVGVILRGGPGGFLFLPGVLFLWSAVLMEPQPRPRSELGHELAACSTATQRCDFEATLDRYPDDVTHDLRDILAELAASGQVAQLPGRGR